VAIAPKQRRVILVGGPDQLAQPVDRGVESVLRFLGVFLAGFPDAFLGLNFLLGFCG
jgi:hypothetical protein